MDADVKSILRRFIADNFMFRGSIDAIGDGASLIKAGIIDSVGILVLISFLEEQFEIKISDDEVEPENLESIDAIASFLARKTQKGGAASAG
jgi:acyl carrier protein